MFVLCANGLQVAEQLFVKGGHIRDAIDMYTTAGRWEEAHKVSIDTNNTTSIYNKDRQSKLSDNIRFKKLKGKSQPFFPFSEL